MSDARIPTFVITWVSAQAADAVAMTMALDLPNPVMLTHAFDGDIRGAAEVATALLEYADVVAVAGQLQYDCAALVRRLARPACAWSRTSPTSPPPNYCPGFTTSMRSRRG